MTQQTTPQRIVLWMGDALRCVINRWIDNVLVEGPGRGKGRGQDNNAEAIPERAPEYHISQYTTTTRF